MDGDNSGARDLAKVSYPRNVDEEIQSQHELREFFNNSECGGQVSATRQAEMERAFGEAKKRAREQQDHARVVEEENRLMSERIASLEEENNRQKQTIQRLEDTTRQQDARLYNLERQYIETQGREKQLLRDNVLLSSYSLLDRKRIECFARLLPWVGNAPRPPPQCGEQISTTVPGIGMGRDGMRGHLYLFNEQVRPNNRLCVSEESVKKLQGQNKQCRGYSYPLTLE